MRRLPPVLILAALIGVALFTSAGAAPRAIPASLHADTVRPGQALQVTGRVDGADAVKLQVQRPDGTLLGPYGPFAVTGGQVDATLPREATPGLHPTRDEGYTEGLGVPALPPSATQTSRAAGAEPPAPPAAVGGPPAGAGGREPLL